MSERIIYQEFGMPVSIVIPCDNSISAIEIGKKDVPGGVKFWIVDELEIPSDRSFRDAWDLDVNALGKESGIGSKKTEAEK